MGRSPYGRRAADRGRPRGVRLASPDLEVTFVPGAGMVGCSLRHRGAELLGPARGLRRVHRGPQVRWASRSSTRGPTGSGAGRFEVGGREVVRGAAAPPPRRDTNGLPMHGLLARRAGLAGRAGTAPRRTVVERDARLRRPGATDRCVPVPARAALDVTVRRADADDRHDGDPDRDRRGAGVVRLPPVPAAARPERARRAVGRDPGARAVACSTADAADRRAASRRRGRARAAGAADVRRCLRRSPGPGARSCSRAAAGGSSCVRARGIRSRRSSRPRIDDVIAFEPMTAPANALVTGDRTSRWSRRGVGSARSSR